MCSGLFPRKDPGLLKGKEGPRQPIDRPTDPRTARAVQGDRAAKLLVVFQVIAMMVATLAFAITAGTSGKAVFVATGQMDSGSAQWPIVLVYCGIELLLCQLPNLESSWITSVLGGSMSFCYAIIALGLCAAQGGRAERAGDAAEGGRGAAVAERADTWARTP